MSFKNSLLFRRSDELAGTVWNPRSPTAEKGKLGKILLAESDPSDLDHIASVLRNLNFTVLTAQDGKAALALARRHSPLLVLSSLDLPQIDGYKLMQQLRERRETEGIPFMFILGSGETPDRLVGHETYAHDYIQKPFLVSELESRVMALLQPVIRKRDESVDSPEAAWGRETPPDLSPIPEETPPRPDEALETILLKMRQGLGELSEALGLLERRLRLLSAIEDAGPGPERTARQAPARESEGGHLIRFQNARNGPDPDDRGDLERIAGTKEGPAGSKPASVAPADTAHFLDALERYRAEYRELLGSREQESSAGPAEEREDPVADRARHEPETGPPRGDDASVGRQPVEAASVGDLEEVFDSDLLVKLGVRVDEPAAARIKEEEFTRFARQSFLSAFLDESGAAAKQDSLYEEAQEYVLRSIRRVAVGGSPYVARAEMLVGRMIDSLAGSNELLLRATERDAPFSISGHSVNVAILSIRIAQIQGGSPQFQSRVGLAALFHEIGVVRLPEKLVFKEEPLDEEELNVLRKRPLYSARVLQESFRLVGDIAGQVFEREDGSGHPMGLRSGEIRNEAKIIGVADFFEACIHQRPYREPLTGYQALYELSRDGAFQQEIVRALVRCVSLFPFNELLLLSTGEVGRVSNINPTNPARPRVRILLDRDGAECAERREIDLLENRGVEIAEVLTPDAVARRRTR